MEFINQAVTVLQTLVVALVPVWLCGVWSTSWRGTAMTIPVPRAGHQAVDGRWRRGTHRHDPHPELSGLFVTSSRVHMQMRENVVHECSYDETAPAGRTLMIYYRH